MSKVKNQHYVPQSYLKNFAAYRKRGASHIWVFDKFNQNTFSTPVRNVASQGYFYDLSKELVDVQDEQWVEKFLADFEGESNKLISHVFKKIEIVIKKLNKKAYCINVITPNVKKELSYLLAIQALRTREFRELFVEFFEKSFSSIAERILEAEFPDEMNEVRVRLDEKSLPIYQAIQMFKSSKNISEIIRTYIWAIGINKTDQPLFTSDNPVVRQAHLGANGFACSGIEIAFPLSPQIIIIIFENTHFSQLSSVDNKLLLLPLEAVNYYNELQVYNSRRQIYCNEDKFNLVKDICKAHPDVCSENKSRIDIISGLNHN